MTVLVNKLRRIHFLSELLIKNPTIIVFAGSVPANVNMSLTLLKTNYQSVMLASYGYPDGPTVVGNTTDEGFRLTESNNDVTALASGTATWWVYADREAYGGDYSYFASDSISLSGGTGMLQLASLDYVAGTTSPNIIDFSITA